jgi:hypothetical protein
LPNFLMRLTYEKIFLASALPVRMLMNNKY